VPRNLKTATVISGKWHGIRKRKAALPTTQLERVEPQLTWEPAGAKPDMSPHPQRSFARKIQTEEGNIYKINNKN
jgi:hypothetical protein